MAGMSPASAWYESPSARTWVHTTDVADTRAFHRSMPGYLPTPLTLLPELATELDVASVWVKDESARLGLPAFKILGASWACAQVIAQRTGAPSTDVDALRRAATGSGIHLVTATDGNHGRAVARMATLLGLSATVFVPAVMSAGAAAAITGEGAEVVRIDSHYDAAVAAAEQFAGAGQARELVQDTAWPGYEQVPARIVAGYDTLLAEIDEQLPQAPDLVAVPVGVGSLAQAVVAHYRRPESAHPAVLGVEPDTAPCALRSLRAGEPVTVQTADTVMAGLNCPTLSALAWPVLRQGCDAAVTVSDQDALRAVADLGRLGVSSGPSGAASLTGARAALTRPERRAALGITRASTVVLLSTEAAPAPKVTEQDG